MVGGGMGNYLSIAQVGAIKGSRCVSLYAMNEWVIMK